MTARSMEGVEVQQCHPWLWSTRTARHGTTAVLGQRRYDDIRSRQAGVLLGWIDGFIQRQLVAPPNLERHWDSLVYSLTSERSDAMVPILWRWSLLPPWPVKRIGTWNTFHERHGSAVIKHHVVCGDLPVSLHEGYLQVLSDPRKLVHRECCDCKARFHRLQFCWKYSEKDCRTFDCRSTKTFPRHWSQRDGQCHWTIECPKILES